ncbi:MAG TPA: serine/threonine-protein kinase [Solirubrobacterales bacterium]|nr:serine/threonine-protein kinase [Solirubrobacterales bacterium]
MPGTIGIGELLKERYRLERTLGRGGMAAVWLGHDEVLDRPVAVKVLSDTIASDPGFVARFRREARTAAGLSHPNLVGVYDFSEEGERPYLVMQFVPGENLAERLERGGGVDCDKLARELLEALDHIHSVGILHRDIKPANIIIEPDGTTKLIDFGIALPADATALTSTGLILGTERYAAPEVMEGEPATERSDLYSCGVVLRSCEGQCSRALGSLIGWLTGADPRSRPVSAKQALARLEREDSVGEEPTQAFQPTFEQSRRQPPPPPSAPRPATSSRGRRGAVAALLAFVAALVAVAALVLGGGDEEKGGGGGQQATGVQKESNGGSQDAAPAAGPESEEPVESEEQAESSGSAEAEPTESVEEPADEPTSTPTASGADPSRASSLNEEGFALIQAGEYEAAVPLLEEAVSAFPEGTEDLDYAYALFNLGNALRLSGRPEEAIPVLEQRLQIPNQTGKVEEELEAARAEAG